jgi:hypothetical protein
MKQNCYRNRWKRRRARAKLWRRINALVVMTWGSTMVIGSRDDMRFIEKNSR